MGISAQGGNGGEGLEQFGLFVCLSDEWKCLWERTCVACSPFLCRKCKHGWQALLSLLPAMHVRACECSWWVRSWEITCMTLSCLHQFEFIHVSGSILFKMQLSCSAWADCWTHRVSLTLHWEGGCHRNADCRSRQMRENCWLHVEKMLPPLLR